MWTVLKALALRLAIGRTLGGVLATFLLLAAIGLPVLFVIVAGGVLLLLVGALLTLSVVALKIVLPIVLIVWLVRWLTSSRSKPAGDAA
jgi:hypothetical protein